MFFYFYKDVLISLVSDKKSGLIFTLLTLEPDELSFPTDSLNCCLLLTLNTFIITNVKF